MRTSAVNQRTSRRKRWAFRGALLLFVFLVIAILVAAGELFARVQRSRMLDGRISALEELVRSNVTYNKALFKGYEGREEEARIHFDTFSKAPLTYRPYIEFRRLPNFASPTFHTNSLAYRGPEFEICKSEGVFRLLLYGGSFVWGTGALSDDETISGQLEEMLNDRLGGAKRFEVINCGESNYHSTQEAVFLLIEGVYLSADLAVFIDGVNECARAYENLPAGYPNPFERFNKLLTEQVRRRHEGVFTVDTELEYLRKQREIVWNEKSSELLERWRDLWANRPQGTFSGLAGDFTTPEEYAIRHYYNIRSVRALGREFGFKTAHVIQPIPLFFKPLHPDEREAIETLRKYDHYFRMLAWWEKYYVQLTDMVQGMCKDAGIPILDLRRIFQDNPKPLYVDQCHLTGEGYHMVAEALYEWLVARGLVGSG